MENSRQQFDRLVDELKIAMMITRTREGRLRSRAMANQKRAAGADLWFVTTDEASALDDIGVDPNINLSYYKDGSSEWISVSGKAVATKDPSKIRELYAADWKMWFNEKESDPRFGTAADPRMVLIGVTIEEATFFAVNESKPVVLFELAKGWMTGTSPHIGETHRL